VVKNNILLAALIRKILFLPPCNILYELYVKLSNKMYLSLLSPKCIPSSLAYSGGWDGLDADHSSMQQAVLGYMLPVADSMPDLTNSM